MDGWMDATRIDVRSALGRFSSEVLFFSSEATRPLHARGTHGSGEGVADGPSLPRPSHAADTHELARGCGDADISGVAQPQVQRVSGGDGDTPLRPVRRLRRCGCLAVLHDACAVRQGRA